MAKSKKQPTPKPYWTPARIAELMAATGAEKRQDFAKICAVSPQLMSYWLNGTQDPSPVHRLALNHVATIHGYPPAPPEPKQPAE